MTSIQNAVKNWYDMSRLTTWVLTREEEIQVFERKHPEVRLGMYHPARQVFRWLRDVDLEIVIWNEPSQSYRMLQDLCFKDAYPTRAEWLQAMVQIVADPQRKVWLVSVGDLLSSSIPV